MPDNSGAVDLGAQRQTEEPTPEETPGDTTKNALYAFAVIADTKGNVQVYSYEAEGVDPILEANNDLVYGACSKVLADISARETADATVQIQMQHAQAMAAKMQEQQLASQFKLEREED